MDESCMCSSNQIIKNDKAPANCDSLEALTADAFKMLMEATKKSNNLPFGKTRGLYESCPSFHSVVKIQLEYILKELAGLLAHTNCSKNIQKRDDEDKFEIIVDANDILLENVGISLDELCGINKNPESKFVSAKASWNRSTSNKINRNTASNILNSLLSQTKNIEKPQLKFKNKVNNDPEVPFEPRIKYKYNMLKPLSCILQKSEDGLCYFTHPYEFELNKFTPSKEQLTYHSPTLYKSLSETPLIMVNTTEDLNQMINDLEKQKEIAVDVEHHSYRSFQGFTCLLQISTRDTDYVIDAIALRSELEALNKVFTDPSIVKVFHGADLDVLWLQKDFSVYIVNLFDTHQAAKLLNFPKLSLAYLLSHYCDVVAQKHFQLADWRIRPLPQELITYAREDTHYLLFIYDNMRNALIEKANNQTNFLQLVISEGTRICLKTYLKPQFESDGYMDMYRRSKKLFDNRQKFALQQLFQWRDANAREWDESYAFVLPDHMMLNISEVLPREAQGILACCNPVPVPVRQNLLVLHQIILKAREQPCIKPILDEQKFYRHTAALGSLDNPLQCPHDLNHELEFRDDLPVLCNGQQALVSGVNDNISFSKICSAPIIDIFEGSKNPDLSKILSVAKSSVHLTPYRLYQLSKTFSESAELKRLNKNKENLEKVLKGTEPAVIEAEPNDEIIRTNAKSESPQKTDREIISNDVQIKADGIGEEKVQRSNAKKRKLENKNSTEAKKKKKTNSTSALANSSASGGILAADEKKNKKKKKLHQGEKKKQFEPFDYKSVDFGKYKSSTISSGRKAEKIQKIKKGRGRKNFKISV